MKLTPGQRKLLESSVKKTRNLSERMRLCVILGRDDGYSPKLLASILRISESSVYDYLKEYDKEGKTVNKPSRGRDCKLSAEQEAELKNYLANSPCTTYNEICRHVLETYNLNYSIPGMRDWLIRNNFARKKSTRVALSFVSRKDVQLLSVLNTHRKKQETTTPNDRDHITDLELIDYRPHKTEACL